MYGDKHTMYKFVHPVIQWFQNISVSLSLNGRNGLILWHPGIKELTISLAGITWLN